MLIIDKTPLGAWHRLLGEAQGQLGQYLNEHLECYLAHTLVHYTSQTDLASRAMALEYLEGINLDPKDSLRVVGDKCLILDGLFPEHAIKRNLAEDYYTKLGQSAYSIVGNDIECQLKELYIELSESFAICTSIISALRLSEKTDKEYQVLTLNLH